MSAELAELHPLSALDELLTALRRAKTPVDIYEAAITSLSAASDGARAAVLLCDSRGGLEFEAWHDLSPEYRQAMTAYSPWPPAAKDARPVVVRDVLNSDSLSMYRDVFQRENIRGLVFIPLEGDDGVFGRCMLYYREPHDCTGTELGIAQLIAGHIGLAIERRRAEAAHLQLAAIVESSDDAIVSKDLNGIITSWNSGAERLFGYTAAEMIGKPVATLAAPDVINEMPRILEKIRRGERVDHFETRRRTKDGKIIDVSLTVSPVRDAAGRVIGASKIARDITSRRRIESERAQLLAREREGRKAAELLNRVGSLLNTELSVGKLVQSVTDIATQLVGAEFGAFFHNVLDEKGESYMLYTLSGVAREAFDKFPMPRNTAVFAPTFRGEAMVRSDDITRDPRYGKNAPYYGMPEGHLPVRSYLAAPVVSRSGEVLGGLFFGHSVPGVFSEQQETMLAAVAAQAAIAMDNARLFEQAQWAQNELKRSNEELRLANQDLETFAYSASHDLQEPLRTIVISAQFLGRRYKNQLSEDASQMLDTLISGAQRMETLIRDVLAYATAAKAAEGARVTVDANDVLASVLEDLHGQISEAGATVTSTKLPLISMHERRLVQVFQNLIGNALKYRSRQPPRVHVSAIERDGWWLFSVADNGIGIDRKFSDQIFVLFKRLHRQDEYPGSGIGLAVCQRIVEQYGGRIWLESSTPGEGSTFCFTVPVADRDVAAQRPTSQQDDKNRN
jgi:PAS domain S-box-containing protein